MSHRFSQNKPLPPVVLTKDDVIKYANFFLGLIQKGHDNLLPNSNDGDLDEYQDVEFSIKYKDKTHEKSNNIEIFHHESSIDSLDILNITMTYHSIKPTRRIELSLNHGNKSHAEISGDNKDWVLAKASRLEEIANSLKPQNMFFKRYKMVLFTFFSLIFGYSIVKILAIINMYTKKYFGVKLEDTSAVENSFGLKFLLAILFLFMLGSFFSHLLMNFLESLFPYTELQVGPAHRQGQAKNRNFIYFLAIVIFLPILTNFLYDFLKNSM